MENITISWQLIGPRTTTAFIACSCYVVLCRILRYARRNVKHAQYPYKTREDFSKMTAEHAWEIVKYVHSLEFPYIAGKSLAFALFKTYGIPTISKLLFQTQQLVDGKVASRRFTDTGILIGEFLGQSPTSERATSAIARMNYLHGRYQKAGKISNDDMLYTLALFMLEVEKWIRLYEWRSLTPMEICALGTHWKNVGDAMEIKYDDLAHGPNDFKDGLEFFEDIREWADAYEKSYLVPAESNHQVAEQTARILMIDVPTSLQPIAKQFIIAIMDNRLRRAMRYDDPPSIYSKLLTFILQTRRLFVRYLLPPRPYFLRLRLVTEYPDPKTERYHTLVYSGEPWYIKPTFWERYAPLSWFRWALGRPYPDGKRYKPEGFTTFEIGPPKLEGKGLEECAQTRDRLMASGRGGCPFGFG